MFDALERAGVDLTDVFLVLENEGVDKFEKSWAELQESVRASSSRPAKLTVRSRPARPRPVSSPERAAEPPTGVVADLVGGSVASRIAAGDPSLGPGGGLAGLGPRPRAPPGRWSARCRALGEAPAGRRAAPDRAGHRGRRAAWRSRAWAWAPRPGTGLVVLDTADPESVADVLAGDLDTTALVTRAPAGRDRGGGRVRRAGARR